MADGNTPNNVTTLNRERLASLIVIFSIIAITILAGVSIATSQNVAGEGKGACLATEELLEPAVGLGRKLLADLGNNAQAIFDELGKRYEVLGYYFTESLRNNSTV